METTKLKLKVGAHEFEAEGPIEAVQQQFAAFQALISAIPQTSPQHYPQHNPQHTENKDGLKDSPHVDIAKIMHVSGRVVSLTALPTSTEDAALLVMLGHKDLRDNGAVTGQEIGDGLAQSGRPVPRVDRIMERALADAFVLKTGIKRATRYRLTNQGLSKALTIARDLIARKGKGRAEKCQTDTSRGKEEIAF